MKTKNLTPEQVMKLISEHSTIGKVTKVMWKAFNAQFATGDEEENKDEEEAKNEGIVSHTQLKVL